MNFIKEKLNSILSEKQNSAAQLESNKGILGSLKIVINVLYALMIFQVFLILPRSDDEELNRYTLSEVFSIHAMELVVVCVGLIMIITYWIQFNRQLGNLVRSSRFHAVLALLQMFFLMIYLYFVRLDLETDGTKFALQMESIFLALAGFIAAINWYYAKRNKLTSENIDEEEEMAILLRIMPEPIASTFSLPFASMGPMVWSISFLIIIPLGFIFNKMIKKR